MSGNIIIYILVMAVVTYLIRMLPLVLIRKEIKSNFIKSFLYYVPFVTLATMIFPAVLYSTGSVTSATIGFIVALVLSYFGQDLMTVSLISVFIVFTVEIFIK